MTDDVKRAHAASTMGAEGEGQNDAIDLQQTFGNPELRGSGGHLDLVARRK